ncbi:MAG: undecaprenyl-diphosphate phosphatase [Rikenellaceae bacterium]
MTIIQSIVLGAVQGITEFLPVSSSGHLQLAKELLGVHLTDNLAFDVALHAGTVLSTLLVLWSEVRWLVLGLFSRRFNEAHIYILKIALSMVPVAIVGFTLKDELDEILSSNYVLLIVGAMLLLTALLLGFAHRTRRGAEGGREIGYGDAFVIGVAQMMAVMPGLSRSGSTIATGILLGNDRSKVAKFSFLMVLAPILGSMLLDIVKGGGEFVVEGVSGGVLFVGFFTAFAVGALACKGMIEIVKRGKLIYFSIYCAIVGVLSIGSYFLKF